VELVVAYDFPVLSLFLSMIWFFLWIAWLFLVFRTIVDIFRSHDLGGPGKAIWLLLVAVLPYLGVFLYVVVRGREMSAREVQRAAEHQDELRSYVRNLAGSPSTADELRKLAELRNSGVLTEAEFAQQKSLLLAG
jgi:putative oligomerization/nucleic acid binding protein